MGKTKTKKGGVVREKTEARHPNLTTKKRMNYTVKVNEAKKEGSNVKAFASVVFGDSFKVCNIAIVENKDGNLFVSMPSYKSSEKNENNEAVYKDICNPITKEFQKELSEAILSAYDKRNELGKNEFRIGGSEDAGEPPFKVSVTPYERDGSNIRGVGRIFFNDSFVVGNVSILQGKNGVFVSMPSYKTKQELNGKPVYQDICFPVTKEFREKLYGSVLKAYDEAKSKAQAEAQKTVAQAQSDKAVAGQEKEGTPFR